MIVKCRHGYFIFEETRPGQISDFVSRYGISVVPSRDHWTFSFLKDAPKYSIIGNPYLGFVATSTIEGDPWEVMRANNIVYDFTLGIMVLKTSVTRQVRLSNTSRYYLSSGLIVPGSLSENGLRVEDYDCHFSNRSVFKYTEVNLA